MSNLKAIFMGTPDFAVPCLEALNKKYDIIAVITQPDRPKGRGQKLTASPVKEFAVNAGLTVLQPEKIKTPEIEKVLMEMKPDLIVVVAFGQILSKRILDIPPLGCINVHASLLPLYRGAAPIHWSIINGETKTGVTTMFMDVGLDTGDMLLKSEVFISDETTTGQLHDQLMLLGADVLMRTVALLETGTVTRIKQDNTISTYASLLTKTTERIDWSLTAKKIHNLVRGLDPWPGSYCNFNSNVFKIWKTKVYNDTN
jgi:methionyl-tRNA formyltransferase